MTPPALIYASYLSTAAVTATDTKSGLAVADVLQAEEDNVWQPANTTGSKSVVIDLGLAQNIGCLAIIGDYLNGVTLEVRCSSDNFGSSDVQQSAASAMTEYITHWRSWTNATYRYWKLIFSGHAADFAVAHVALCKYDLLPWLDDGADLDIMAAEGVQLISPDGRFLGSNRLRTMRPISLDWGQLTDAEYILFQLWADACVKQMQPFFFVPDTSQTACHFGWCDAKYKFSAPSKNGLCNIAKIPFNARVV